MREQKGPHFRAWGKDAAVAHGISRGSADAHEPTRLARDADGLPEEAGPLQEVLVEREHTFPLLGALPGQPPADLTRRVRSARGGDYGTTLSELMMSSQPSQFRLPGEVPR